MQPWRNNECVRVFEVLDFYCGAGHQKSAQGSTTNPMSDDSPERLQCPPEVPDAFAYASGYINGQAARRRSATAKAEQPYPQAIRARKVTEQLIADLWSRRDTEKQCLCAATATRGRSEGVGLPAGHSPRPSEFVGAR
jgi:hypothetical protein